MPALGQAPVHPRMSRAWCSGRCSWLSSVHDANRRQQPKGRGRSWFPTSQPFKATEGPATSPPNMAHPCPGGSGGNSAGSLQVTSILASSCSCCPSQGGQVETPAVPAFAGLPLQPGSAPCRSFLVPRQSKVLSPGAPGTCYTGEYCLQGWKGLGAGMSCPLDPEHSQRPDSTAGEQRMSKQ
jgi:hypothetical protein